MRLLLAFSTLLASLPAFAADDCASYHKDVMHYFVKQHVDPGPLKPDAADQSKSEICIVSFKQDKEGFITELGLAKCPSKNREAIAAAILKAQPIPAPAIASCRGDTFWHSYQTYTETKNYTEESAPGK